MIITGNPINQAALGAMHINPAVQSQRAFAYIRPHPSSVGALGAAWDGTTALDSIGVTLTANATGPDIVVRPGVPIYAPWLVDPDLSIGTFSTDFISQIPLGSVGANWHTVYADVDGGDESGVDRPYWSNGGGSYRGIGAVNQAGQAIVFYPAGA